MEMGHVRISENGEFLNLFWWKWGMSGFQKQVNLHVCFHGNAAHRISEKGEFPRRSGPDDSKFQKLER